MEIETERKFLVLDDGYKAQAVESHRIRQGYIAHDMGRSVRVRILDDRGFLTIKGPFIGVGSRPEWAESKSSSFIISKSLPLPIPATSSSLLHAQNIPSDRSKLIIIVTFFIFILF